MVILSEELFAKALWISDWAIHASFYSLRICLISYIDIKFHKPSVAIIRRSLWEMVYLTMSGSADRP